MNTTNNTSNRDRGFISQIVLIIVALVILQFYFHIDVYQWIKDAVVYVSDFVYDIL